MIVDLRNKLKQMLQTKLDLGAHLEGPYLLKRGGKQEDQS